MNERSPLWRAILWIERFLPKVPLGGSVESPTARKNGVAAASLMIFPALVLTSYALSSHGLIWRGSHLVIEQLVLLVAVLCAVAVIVAGVLAWRRVRKSHA